MSMSLLSRVGNGDDNYSCAGLFRGGGYVDGHTAGFRPSTKRLSWQSNSLSPIPPPPDESAYG